LEEKRDWRRRKGIGGGEKGLKEEKRDWRRKKGIEEEKRD